MHWRTSIFIFRCCHEVETVNKVVHGLLLTHDWFARGGGGEVGEIDVLVIVTVWDLRAKKTVVGCRSVQLDVLQNHHLVGERERVGRVARVRVELPRQNQ